MNLFTVLILGFIACSAAQTCQSKTDLIFVLDSSGSIGRSSWKRMKHFISNVIRNFNVGPNGTRVAAVTYSTNAFAAFKLNTLTGTQLTANNYEKIIKRMVLQRGLTYIDRGISKANIKLLTSKTGMRGKDVPKIMLIITDGYQTKYGSTPLSEAIKPVIAKGVQIHSLGIGRRFNRAELQMMSSNPLTNVHTVPSFRKLNQYATKISKLICPEANHKCRNHRCRGPYSYCVVENDRPVCRCMKCYYDDVSHVCGSDNKTYNSECYLKKASCEANTMITIASRKACACKATMDIAFIVDSSGSIGRRNWRQMKRFLVNTISRLNIGPSGTHVAVVTYSTNATVEFDFTLKGNPITLVNYKKVISAMRLHKGLTFIDKGLKLANEKIFTVKNGMRGANIPKVALVITDGIQMKHKGPFTPLVQASAPLKNKGVHVYALGIGNDIDVMEIVQIGSHPDYVFVVKSFDDLKKFARTFVLEACRKASQ